LILAGCKSTIYISSAPIASAASIGVLRTRPPSTQSPEPCKCLGGKAIGNADVAIKTSTSSFVDTISSVEIKLVCKLHKSVVHKPTLVVLSFNFGRLHSRRRSSSKGDVSKMPK